MTHSFNGDLPDRYRGGVEHSAAAPVVTSGPDVLFNPEDFAGLDGKFPSGLLRHGSRHEKETADQKTYSVSSRTAYDRGAWQVDPAELPAVWKHFIDEVTAPGYQQAMAETLGFDTESVGRVEVRLAEYSAGGWMSRHTDRPDKVYSQLIYFCPGWRREWGGHLKFYADEHTPDPLVSLAPGAGNTAAFLRTDTSWHEVMSVAKDAARPRRMVLLHGYLA